MLQYLLSQVQSLMQTARETYGVNPVIFLILYFGSVPLWYYSLFRTIKAAAARSANLAMLWSALFLVATVLPFVYVMLFGHNIPWWVYALIAVLVVQGLFSLVRRLRQASTLPT